MKKNESNENEDSDSINKNNEKYERTISRKSIMSNYKDLDDSKELDLDECNENEEKHQLISSIKSYNISSKHKQANKQINQKIELNNYNSSNNNIISKETNIEETMKLKQSYSHNAGNSNLSSLYISNSSESNNKHNISFQTLMKYMELFVYKNNYTIIFICVFIPIRLLSSYLWSTSFLFSNPPITCSDTIQTLNIKCNLNDVCAYNKKHNEDQITFSLSNNIPESYSLISYFHLECKDSAIGFLSSSVLVGFFLSNFGVAFVIEKYGFVNPLIITLLIDTVVRVLRIVIKNIIIEFICIIISCMATTCYFIFLQSYISQMTTPKKRGLIILISISACPISGICYSIIFHLSQSYIALEIFNLILSVISIILAYFFLVESPIINHKRSKYDEMYISLEKIAKYNQVSEFYNDYKEESYLFDSYEKTKNQQVYGNKRLTYLQAMGLIFHYKKELYMLIFLTILNMTNSFASFYNSIDIKNSSNLFLDPVIFYSLDFIVLLSCSFLIEKKRIGRKALFCICFIISLVTLSVQTALSFTVNKNYYNTCLCLIIRIAISTGIEVQFLYIIEVFSLDVMNYALSTIRVLGKGIAISFPFIYYANRSIATLLLATLFLVNLVMVIFSEETMGRKLYETIKQKNIEYHKIEEEIFTNDTTENGCVV